MGLNLEQIVEARTAHSRRDRLARRPAWERQYAVSLVALDAIALVIAATLAQILRFGFTDTSLSRQGTLVPYSLVAVSMALLWLGVIALSGGYEPRVVGNGSEEFRRVLNAAVRLLALVAIVFYAARIDVARGFVGWFLPVATTLILVGRYCARRWLHRHRSAGRHMHRVVVVGTAEAATELTLHLQRSAYAGYSVVGACLPSGVQSMRVGEQDVPVLGRPEDDILDALLASRADVLAVAGDGVLAPGALRALAWQLEGTGVDLIVAPSVIDVAGPRIAVHPVAGVPLLHVEEPRLSGSARLFKELFDRVAAGLALVALSPFLLAIGLAVRRTSPGPAMFRQERVGREGRAFTIRKFRTMVVTAEDELENLVHLNEHDGLLFKLRQDPRCTPVGRWLRRFSLDELPQLWHVLTGHMSLVGPRPPLRREVDRYGDDVRRRLLVKPGLTGLWQVSGRADLAWDETVRLDLYYVDNWSPALDFQILWKTVNAVIRGRGAY